MAPSILTRTVKVLRVTGGMACTYARSIRARNLAIVRRWLEHRGNRERLPERKSEILAEGAKLKFALNASGEIEILGNRKGLSALAAICSGLSESAKDDHHHWDEQFWGTEFGSVRP